MKIVSICVILVSGLLLSGLYNEASAVNLLSDPGFDQSLVDGNTYLFLEWMGSSYYNPPWEGGSGCVKGPGNQPGGGGNLIVNSQFAGKPCRSQSNSAISFVFGSSLVWSCILQSVPVTAGQTYRGSAYFNRAADSNIGSGEATGAVIVSWYTGTGEYIGLYESTDRYSQTDPINEWLLKTGTVTAPDNASKAAVGIGFIRGETEFREDYNIAEICVDDLSFEVTSDGAVGFELSACGYGFGQPVPEPASLLLIGSGLVGLFGIGRKRI